MARPRKRRKLRNPSIKVSRKNANKHFKKVYHDEAQEIDIEEIKKSLGTEEGIIERDEKGNVIDVIIGRSREEEEEEVFDTEIGPAPAKTDIIKGMLSLSHFNL